MNDALKILSLRLQVLNLSIYLDSMCYRGTPTINKNLWSFTDCVEEVLCKRGYSSVLDKVSRKGLNE